MANTVTTQTLLDGDRRVVVLLTGLLDTSNEARVVKVDATALVPRFSKLRVDRVYGVVSGNIHVILDWDATTPVRFAALNGGQFDLDASAFGGFQNNAGAGVTGSIALTTAGYAATTTCSYTIVLMMSKVSL